MRKLTTEEFIAKAKEIHGDTYDYSKVNYVNARIPVTIICPIHGEFKQRPSGHLNGKGCFKCYGSKKKTTDEFVFEAKKIHGDKYDYSKTVYVDNKTKVCITCPKHGDFLQSPVNHIKGQGCSKCNFEKQSERNTMSTNEFIERANIIHNNYYDYSITKYIKCHHKVDIICKKHGVFSQTPSAHLSGQGCPLCGIEKSNNSRKYDTEGFIRKARAIHGDKYDYSKAVYEDYYKPLTIICPIHGEFEQTPDSHLQGRGCKKCGVRYSYVEDEIIEYIKTFYNGRIVKNDRKSIKPYEIDIFLPDIMLGIEYHGLLWHSDYFEDTKNKHINKLLLCKDKGIRLIQIFEDEYQQRKDITLSKIKHIIGCSDTKYKIYGRNCTIREIDYKTSERFLEKNHIQGSARSTVYIGAYANDKLVAVMTFKKELNENDKWELTRFASDNAYICCGVGGKLFKYFTTNYNPSEIKSFADRRWTVNEENNVYLKLNFKFDSYTRPDYTYYHVNHECKRYHKFNFRKSRLINKYNFDSKMKESEMAEKLGYYKVWNCGLIKYVWRK